jgi:hypothetical protein
MKPLNTETFLSAVLVLTVVAGTTAHAQWQGTIRDSAGIALITNTDHGIWDKSTQWRVEQDLKIGIIDGDPNYQFGGIGWIAVGSSGQIYVLDTQAQSVRAFSPKGQYEQTFGGPGGGPGEIGPGAIFVVAAPGDTLLVPDLANRRINRYAPDGSNLPSVPLQIEKALPLVWRSTSGGDIASQMRPLGLTQAAGTSATKAAPLMDAITLIGADGLVKDTILQFRSGNTISIGGGVPEINMYTPEPAWAISDQMHLIYGLNDEYRLRVYGHDGSLQRIITMPFEQRPVSESDKRIVMDYLETAWLDAGVPPQALPRLRSVVHFGEHFPAYAALQSGPDGSIWVQHVQAASDLSQEERENYNLIEDSGAPEWDVFDSEGRYLGIVTLPDRFAPRIFRGDKIYGVWRDESDVQYVMLLRLVGPAPRS